MTRRLANDAPALRACWHPVGYSREVDPGPVAVTLLGEPYVLVRLDDQVTALPGFCPHRGAPLAAGRIVDGTLQCAYHGYRYAADGTCVRIPSQDAALPVPSRAHLCLPAAVSERYGIVWIAPEPPLTPLPEVPEFGAPGWVAIAGGSQRWNAGAAQMQDNFIDYAHFAYRHASTFGDEDEIDISAEPTVERDGWTFTGSHFHMVKDPEDPAGPDAAVGPRQFHLTYVAPFVLITRVTYPNTGLVTVLFQMMQPETADTTRIFGYMIRNDMAELGVKELEAPPDFEDRISEEDRWLLEQFPNRAMPIDLQAELHTRADRHTVELRRILNDLVDAYERRADLDPAPANG
jgi:vanillate O-demethylase monooxygenase subunit